MEAQNDIQKLIDGSGLFFFQSNLDTKIKLEIITWYKKLKTVMEAAADYCTGIPGLVTVDPKIRMNLNK